MARSQARTHRPLAAIDVGTNAARLLIVRVLPDGAREILHQERDPVRPGEGVFATGSVPRPVADRLLNTLRRYANLCQQFDAEVRAVATSALREARNGQDVVARVLQELGIELEIISGQEEARLICLGVLEGTPAGKPSVLIDIGGGSTEVASSLGEQPRQMWSVNVGAVRLTEIFETDGKVGAKKLELLRRFAEEAFREALTEKPQSLTKSALGSSGTIGAVVAFASDGGTRATRAQITRAVEKLAAMSTAQKRKAFDARRAQVVVAGAVVLEQAMKRLDLGAISAVTQGLRQGVIVELLRRREHAPADPSRPAAAIALGRRFGFDEAHARHVAALSLSLFDALSELHGLPDEARPLLETAALLHDLGHAVSPQRHHKHTEYLVRNADIAGMTDHERALAALVARFHRRSAPERSHPSLATLTAAEFKMVRRASTLLRIADGLDRSRRQPVSKVRVTTTPTTVRAQLETLAPVELELWDVEREAALFQRVFNRRLEVVDKRMKRKR